MATDVTAPAKVNLTLHVTGQRADGYHLLDSLVVFGGAEDRISIQAGNTLSLTVEGPEARDVPADMENLVLKMARMLGPDRGETRGAAITLTKNLPVASGIGGGSADAAAVFRGLLHFWQMEELAHLSLRELEPVARQFVALGADIPVCILSRPARMRGIGEQLTYLPTLPPLPAVLVNPRVPVATPAVFRTLTRKDNPAMPDEIPQFATAPDLAAWLALQRNDLQAPAMALQPAIGTVLDVIASHDGCLLARMSGSGATCFGLFADAASAQAAADRIRHDHPEWWVADWYLGDYSQRVLGQIT